MSDAVDVVVEDDFVRGGVWLLSAKVVAVLGGFGLYWLLAIAFSYSAGAVAGTAALGVWGATFGVINPLNTMASNGTLQVMSRAVASRGAGRAIFARTALLQLASMCGVFAALQLLAVPIARHVLNDASYVPYLRVAAWIPLLYGLRALYEGYLNGTRRFREQALIDIGATLLRFGLVLLGAFLGYGVFGAVTGFVIAAATMAVVVVGWIRPAGVERASPPGTREILSFQMQVIGVTLATQYLINVDLIAVKALASPEPAIADRLAGYYTASQKLAQVPLSIVTAIAFVLFSYVASDDHRAPGMIRSGTRVLLLLIVPVAAMVSVNAHETLLLVFPTIGRTMLEAGDPRSVVSGSLSVLVLGYIPFALFVTTTSLITASGHSGRSALIAIGTLALMWIAVRGATPVYGPAGTALAASAAWTAGLGASAIAVWRRWGRLVEPLSALRIALAGAVTAALGAWIATDGLLLLVEYAILGAGFLALLRVTGELQRGELRGIALRVLGRTDGGVNGEGGGELQ